MSRFQIIAGFLCVVLAVALGWGVYATTYQRNLEQLSRAGRIRVEQAVDRLLGQLATYRVLVNTLADHPEVIRTARDGTRSAATAQMLVDTVLKYGADEIVVTDRGGHILAASTQGAGDLAGSPLLAAAMNGRLGMQITLDGGLRLFRFSHGVIDGRPPAVGVVQVTASIGELEFEWGIDPEPIAFFDGAGIVVAANRQSLLLRQDRADGQADLRYEPFPANTRDNAGGHEVWSFAPGSALPESTLVVTRDVSHIRMTARGFIDVAPARSLALLRALLAGGLVVLIGLAVQIVALSRRRMADRLAIEAAANAQLEARVEARTAELRETQHQLVQASKLTALGQMSAGISHELNQPLAAIMTFAENGGKLLDRERIADARDNLERIADQVGRINRIIRNLRGFARNEEEPVEPVDLAAAVHEALNLMAPAIAGAAAELHWEPPLEPVMVMGGKVRLEQVIVNLLSNALDAMEGSPEPHLHLEMQAEPKRATLTVRDTGPGLRDPSRVFEPFYSTKELGASKGLGLGLSISYGIIGSFGGDILCRNHTAGGAVFTVILPRPGEGGD